MVTHIRVRMFPGIIIVIIVINTKMSPKSSSSAQIISQMSHISKLFILFHTLLGQHTILILHASSFIFSFNLNMTNVTTSYIQMEAFRELGSWATQRGWTTRKLLLEDEKIVIQEMVPCIVMHCNAMWKTTKPDCFQINDAMCNNCTVGLGHLLLKNQIALK